MSKVLRFIPPVARILMGLLFLLTGLNGFLHFLPNPPTVPDFAIALVNTHYMFPLIMGVQIIFAVLMLANRFVPFALVFIAPVVVNIVAFHFFLDRSGIPMALIVLVLYSYLVYAYRNYYRVLFAVRAAPAAV